MLNKYGLEGWDEVQSTLPHCLNPPLEYQVINIMGVEKYIFNFPEVYKGRTNPILHVDGCVLKWNKEGFLEKLWVHNFIYTLGISPKAYYLHEEVYR